MIALLGLPTLILTAIGPLLSGIFNAAWSFISAAWKTEIGRLVIVSLCVWVACWYHVHKGEAARRDHAVAVAVAARDKHWETEISDANKEADRRVELARAAAKAVVAVAPNATSAQLAELCRANVKTCRDALKR